MEFDLASKRLQREQQQRSKLPSSKLPRSMMTMNGTPQQLKERQLQQKQLRQQQEEKRQKERQQKLFESHLFHTYRQKYDALLHVQSLVSPSSTSSTTPTSTTLPVVLSPSPPPPLQHLQLIPVSIHGNGDKITLPPSLLERLLPEQPERPAAAPWTFRLGIRNPVSLLTSSLVSPELQSFLQEHFRHNDDLPDEMDDDEDDDDIVTTSPNNRPSKKQFLNDMSYYMKELQQYQYLSYTHGTVIEFTQEEGYIGIPKAVAAALLTSTMETTRTIDPASAVAPDETMEDHGLDGDDNDVGEKTPGHVAYNAFDIPAVPIEIVWLQLPKGTGMTLRPLTKSFYHLQQDQIKFALEQSIQRTRATITLYDTLTTWYRGKEYQFLVTKLVTSSSPTNCYNAISCINTDMEIDFEPMPTDDTETPLVTDVPTTTTSSTSTGRRLMDETPRTTITTTSVPNPDDDTSNTMVHYNIKELPPEPPIDDTNRRIITIQFRFPHPRPFQQRRFDITTTTIRDLFTFVAPPSRVQLVRRYPRRIFGTPQDDHWTLEQAGFQSGNELLIVEEL